MKYFFITGTSSGLGNSLANSLLQDSNNRVIGLSRTNKIHHTNFKHFSIDFNNLKKLQTLFKDVFTDLIDPEKVILVNNAGTLGDIAHVGRLDNENLQQIMNVNFTAPAMLCNEFLKKYLAVDKCSKLILNISSGAGKKATDGWGGYCASKAALDIFSEVIAVEKQKNQHDLKIFSVAPGIVDTAMQDQIRQASKDEFSRLDEFVEFKKENMLVSPDKVAEKLLYIIEHEKEFHEPIISVRDI
jgi:benzil reductase ((S)-benzoin forming)